MSNSIFDYLNSINNKIPIEIEKDFSGYMVSLWLSQSNDCIEYVNDINNYIFSLSPDSLYKYYYYKIPKKKRFIKWTKKSKKTENEDYTDIKIKYNLSDNEIKKLYKGE